MGKPLPSNIYALITYIESNILEESSKKKLNPQLEKAKVLRETKFIPKIVLCIENFNKHVILLAKKTNDRLANFLHFGTVRDFRIKTSDLKAVIDRTLSHSSQIENEDGDVNEVEGEEDEESLLKQIEEESREIQIRNKINDNDEQPSETDGESTTTTTTRSSSRSSTPNEPTTSKKSQKKLQEKTQNAEGKVKDKDKAKEKSKENSKENLKRKADEDKNLKEKSKEKSKKQRVEKDNKKKNTRSSKANEEAMEIDSDDDNNDVVITPEDGETLDNESNRESCTQLMENLAKINAKTAKKRSLRGSEPQKDPDVLCAPPLEPVAKKRRGTRQSKRGK